MDMSEHEAHADTLAKRVAACSICLAIGGMTVTTMLVALPGAATSVASGAEIASSIGEAPVGTDVKELIHDDSSDESLMTDVPTRGKFDPDLAAMTSPGY